MLADFFRSPTVHFGEVVDGLVSFASMNGQTEVLCGMAVRAEGDHSDELLNETRIVVVPDLVTFDWVRVTDVATHLASIARLAEACELNAPPFRSRESLTQALSEKGLRNQLDREFKFYRGPQG